MIYESHVTHVKPSCVSQGLPNTFDSNMLHKGSWVAKLKIATTHPSDVVGLYIVDLQINISEWIFYKCGDNQRYAINGIAINFVHALLLYLHMIIHYNNKKYTSIFRKRDLLSAWFDLHSSVVVAVVNFSISLFCCCKKGTMTTSRGISVKR